MLMLLCNLLTGCCENKYRVYRNPSRDIMPKALPKGIRPEDWDPKNQPPEVYEHHASRPTITR